MTPELSVIVLNYETRDLLLECLESVEQAIATPGLNGHCEVIVVDNGSQDGSAEAVGNRISKRVAAKIIGIRRVGEIRCGARQRSVCGLSIDNKT